MGRVSHDPSSSVGGVWLEPVERSELLIGSLHLRYHKNMKREPDQPKRRGRPATGTNPLIGVRFPQPEIDALDEWRSKQPGIPSRSEAIRRLVRLALSGSRGSKK